MRAQRIHNFSYKLGGASAKGEQIMTEASGGSGRAEVERRLVQRSLEDEDFRQRLLDDPKGIIEQEVGSQLPEGVAVRVVEESAQTIYLVLPFRSADLRRLASSPIRTLRRWPEAPLRIGPNCATCEHCSQP